MGDKLVSETNKFKAGDKMIDRILWDPKYKDMNFTIGYQDRFYGIMETSFEEYMESDIKDHRLQYIRTDDKLMWDR